MVCEPQSLRATPACRPADGPQQRAAAVARRLCILSLLALMGCNRNLDQATAEKLLTAEFQKEQAQCVWGKPTQKTLSEWIYWGYDETQNTCAHQLEKSQLARVGGCHSEGCGSCCERLIEATSKARLEKSAGGLAFTCGQMKLTRITSIITEGNKATVKFEREVTLDPLVAELTKCTLTKPDTGLKERDREFVRDDAGTWLLKPR